MIQHIPSQQSRRWTGNYLGNFDGNLWRSFNVDLDKSEGKIGLSRRLISTSDSGGAGNDSNLNVVSAFLRTNADGTDRWWGLIQDTSDCARLFRVLDRDPGDTWIHDPLSNTPLNCNDFTIHVGAQARDQLFVTTDTDISVLNDAGSNAWNGAWWVTTKSQTALDSNFVHPIESWKTRRLTLIGDGNLIHTINDSEDVTASRLVLPFYLQADHIFFTTDRAWILCSHKFGQQGAIVEWDGISLSPNQIHSGYGVKMMTGVNWEEIPIVVNNKGVILEYTGNGFTPMRRGGRQIAFPMAEEIENSFRTDPADADNRSPSLLSRGASVAEDGLIYFNIAEPRLPSYRQNAGIWCLNPETGRLYNKYSIGLWGDSVDFGQQSVFSAGALEMLPSDSSSNNRGLLVGGRIVKRQASILENHIWMLEGSTDTTATRGYFITQYIPADEIRDFWEVLWIRFRRFITSGNRIIIKARGVRSLQTSFGEPLDITPTWASSTTFTEGTTSANDEILVGDEIEVLNGDNAGLLAHIISISGAHGGAQTFTIDETLPNSSSTNISLARIERWKKLGVMDSSTKYEDKVNVGVSGSFIQFKVEMRGPFRELEIESMVLTSKSHTNAM